MEICIGEVAYHTNLYCPVWSEQTIEYLLRNRFMWVFAGANIDFGEGVVNQKIVRFLFSYESSNS